MNVDIDNMSDKEFADHLHKTGETMNTFQILRSIYKISPELAVLLALFGEAFCELDGHRKNMMQLLSQELGIHKSLLN
jgi:hypothetical protein